MKTKTLLIAFLLASAPVLAAPRIAIQLNAPSDYNLKNADRILAQRIKTVKNYPNLFGGDYAPSPDVFGQLIDGKAWWGMKGINCYGAGAKSSEGFSKDSHFINNPFLMVGVDTQPLSIPEYNCGNQYAKPTSLLLNLDTRTMNVKYSVSSYVKPFQKYNVTHTFALNLLNARDFGYDYAYVSESKNVHFLAENNIAIAPIAVTDEIKVEGACGQTGGCNGTVSATDGQLFQIDSYPASMTIKLWRNKPATVSATPDLTYEMQLN